MVAFIATNADGMGDRATNDGGTTDRLRTLKSTMAANRMMTEKMHTIVVISARIPDMNPRDDDSFGYPPVARDLQTLMMIVASSAGIKNPTEETDNHAQVTPLWVLGEDRGCRCGRRETYRLGLISRLSPRLRSERR